MPSSTSAAPDGIILDTNVLSSFAVANKLYLLPGLTSASFYITPHIAEELNVGVNRGVSALTTVLGLINSAQITILQLTNTEKAMQFHLPKKLAQGEAEAITICRQRNMLFITHDRKAANYCDREGIPCIRLKDLLHQMVIAGLLSQGEMDSMLARKAG
jgi:predicted nucleic acid-binding protein